MKRPQQHIIETTSKKRFEELIPDTWVARELGSDYGLDYLVEIFKDNNSTGHLFFVQLKGTDKEIINNIISYQLSIDNINYWNTIINPILLVFYNSKLNKFWGIWTNELKENIILRKNDQKKFTIKLTDKHLLTEDFFKELESIFDNTIPSKINVTYRGNSNETKLLHQHLEKWLKYFFEDKVHFENHMLPNTCIVEYQSLTPDSITIQITIKGKTLNLQPVEFSGNENFLFLPDIEIGKVPEQISECLLVFALLNCEKNIKKSITIIQSTIGNYTGDYLSIESFLLLTKTAIQDEMSSELNELAKTLILSNKINEFQFVNTSILMLNEDDKLDELYQTNLKFAIEKVSDTQMKGIFSYNLANSFRSSGDYYSSSLNYQNARKFEPKYKERFYWWFEYAGVLFLSGHSQIAEAFYLKSHELESEHNIPLIFGLIGDCNFFQGKFSESIVYFDKLIEHIERPSSSLYEFILKSIVAKNLVASKLDKLPVDIALSIKLTREGLEKEQEELFEKAIIANPVNGLAWFNYSISLNLRGDIEGAFRAFTTTACIQSWDSEAWCNSLLLAFSTKHFDLFPIIYGAAYKSIGSKFLNIFSQSILDQPNLPMEAKRELIKVFTDISKEYVTKQDFVAK
ncbi:MAG: DUF4365 domain-containing protein [Proteiniphilum sp.]|jgi:tetratricopeptide (TPR) repeat protein|uniref:DUF4365 domain-containing protein n=1 Tax=Proteiniphilum sp. TaxID=1926877 RepID=UPI002B1EB3E2|nr:DUF4365 domain-containing protein [Proteiniphilum sp.]MEA5128300.1 DUF4365 domain-containing protein [Proteiniphilum sp.]